MDGDRPGDADVDGVERRIVVVVVVEVVATGGGTIGAGGSSPNRWCTTWLVSFAEAYRSSVRFARNAASATRAAFCALSWCRHEMAIPISPAVEAICSKATRNNTVTVNRAWLRRRLPSSAASFN